MKNYFQTKVKYTIQKEDGTFKKVVNQILIESDSFTITEAILTEQLSQVVKGDFKIMEIKRFEINEIFYDEKTKDDEPFFFFIKARYIPSALDDEKVKPQTLKYLVQGKDLELATKFIISLNQTLPNFEVVSCVMSPLEDVILAND
jgi:hypothetical protein